VIRSDADAANLLRLATISGLLARSAPLGLAPH